MIAIEQNHIDYASLRYEFNGTYLSRTKYFSKSTKCFYVDGFDFINLKMKIHQATINNAPPIGVTGPRNLNEKPINSERDKQ